MDATCQPLIVSGTSRQVWGFLMLLGLYSGLAHLPAFFWPSINSESFTRITLRPADTAFDDLPIAFDALGPPLLRSGPSRVSMRWGLRSLFIRHAEGDGKTTVLGDDAFALLEASCTFQLGCQDYNPYLVPRYGPPSL